MFDHIFRRFPEYSVAIQALADADPTVRTILADYEEMCTWMATHDGSQKPEIDQIEHAQYLIKDLESEIQRKLEEYDEHNR